MKKRRGRLFGTLMSAVLLTAELAGVSGLAFGANPVKVQADNGEPIMQLGTSGIVEGDIIEFGKVTNDANFPYDGRAEYRVLDARHDNCFGENAMFVLSDGLWADANGSVPYADGSNEWQGSQAQGWCSLFYDNNLSSVEQSALVSVTIPENNPGWVNSGLSGEKVFFVSDEELNFFFPGNDNTVRMAYYGDQPQAWWTRTHHPDDNDIVRIVDNDGAYYEVSPNTANVAGRPAFNIDTTKVLFSSMTGFKNEFMPDNLDSVPEIEEVNTWSLTILDKTLWVDFSAAASYEGNARKILLSDFETSGNGNMVSVLITDKKYNENGAKILRYGMLDEDNSFIIPDGLSMDGWGTDYHIYIVEEKFDDDHASDYASEMVEVLAPGEVYDVTVTAGTGGTATADCDGAVEGEIVTLTATPSVGYRFKEWEVVDGDVEIDNVKSASTTFEMPAEAVSVKAVFEALAEDETSVTVTAGKGGKAEADKLSAKAGDEVKITAEADKDYEFDKWTVVSGDIEIADEKEADTTFVVNSVDEPIEIEAVFKKADLNGGKEPSGHNHHQCEKGHLYAYTICQAPTTEVDGYATWRCARCGIIDPLHADELDEEGFIVIPAFPVFNSTLNDNIKGAKDNATVSISTKRWTGVSRTVLASLAERKDVTLEISFVYMNVEYVITLKGDDPRLAELLNMEVKENCLGLKLIYDYVNAPAIQ